MTEHQKKVQQAIDLMMQLDVIDTEIFIEAVKSGYFKQDHTETELQAYIENARRQAAKNGGVFAMTAEASENIEKLVSILLTFTPDQMAAFVAGAREILAQYTPKE